MNQDVSDFQKLQDSIDNLESDLVRAQTILEERKSQWKEALGKLKELGVEPKNVKEWLSDTKKVISEKTEKYQKLVEEIESYQEQMDQYVGD